MANVLYNAVVLEKILTIKDLLANQLLVSQEIFKLVLRLLNLM